MGLAIRANTGALEGTVFPVVEGLTFGRQSANINLNDPKVSSLHAKVTGNAEGDWILSDNDSKNGIRDESGEKVTTVYLRPGIRFYIGDSLFEVLHVEEEAPPPEKNDAPQGRRYWYDVLAEFMEDHAKKFRDKIKPVVALDPALVLDFVRGVQVSTKWILGYGPRKIGPASMDLPIWEPGAPSICFEIFPSPDGLMFKTNHSHLVQLNGQEVDSEVLRMGDTIKIMDTLIEVDFIE
jgi:hypothetical protein